MTVGELYSFLHKELKEKNLDPDLIVVVNQHSDYAAIDEPTKLMVMKDYRNGWFTHYYPDQHKDTAHLLKLQSVLLIK